MFKKGTPITAEEVFKSIFDISNKEISFEPGGREIITRGHNFSSVTIFEGGRKGKRVTTFILYNKKYYTRIVAIGEKSDGEDRKITTSYLESETNELGVPFPPFLSEE